MSSVSLLLPLLLSFILLVRILLLGEEAGKDASTRRLQFSEVSYAMTK
jgi:hypothetical protein